MLSLRRQSSRDLGVLGGRPGRWGRPGCRGPPGRWECPCRQGHWRRASRQLDFSWPSRGQSCPARGPGCGCLAPPTRATTRARTRGLNFSRPARSIPVGIRQAGWQLAKCLILCASSASQGLTPASQQHACCQVSPKMRPARSMGAEPSEEVGGGSAGNDQALTA